MYLTRLALTGLAMTLVLPATTGWTRGQLQAGPTQLEIAAIGQATRLKLRNTGTAPVAAQVRIFVWSQEHGEDRLLPTDDLVVSPPILELPEGGEHIVRIIRVGAAAIGSDRSYRVVVDELPGDDAQTQNQIAVRMRYVIPLYVRATGATVPELQCQIADDALQLRCDNHGGRAAQLGPTAVRMPDGQRLELSPGLFGYVLPGAWRTWPLPQQHPELSDHPLYLETQVNGRPDTFPIARAP